MPVFPQLLTGVLASNPIRKKLVYRTLENTMLGGARVALPDDDAASVVWEIDFRGLTRTEAAAIENLFQQMNGQVRTFTMLDPIGNLLTWSEDLTQSTWVKDPLIQVTGGIADPYGGTRGVQITNASQASGGVTQTASVPGSYRYCFSVWARAAVTQSVVLAMGNASTTSRLDPTWKRIYVSGSPGLATMSVPFQVILPPGATAQLFGLQVEPQLGPSAYKVTTAHGGVYGQARFASDEMVTVVQGTDAVDAMVQIYSREH